MREDYYETSKKLREIVGNKKWNLKKIMILSSFSLVGLTETALIEPYTCLSLVISGLIATNLSMKYYTKDERKKILELQKSQLKHVKKLVNKYKPQIEGIFKYKIEDIDIGLHRSNNTPILNKTLNEFLYVFFESRIGMSTQKGRIDIDRLESKEFVHQAIVHELAHRITHKINPDLIDKLNIYDLKDFAVGLYLIEGFAEYVSMDLFENKYPSFVKEHITNEREKYLKYADSSKYIPYDKGYKFFHEIGKKLNLEQILDIIKEPERVSLQQINYPQLYLEDLKN